MNKSTECPTCENANPHKSLVLDNSYYCEECGHEWTVEIPSIDNQILDLAEQMEVLIKSKGFKNDSKEMGVSFITINLWHDDSVEVECSYQDIKTIRRKKA